MIATHHATAELDFTTPLTSCCNCGATSGIELVETPLFHPGFRRDAGREVTIRESFPYCPACRASAGRLRHGVLTRMVFAAVFTAFVAVAVFALARGAAGRLLPLAIVASAVGCGLYFRWRDSDAGGRSYYQPVRLEALELVADGQAIRHLRLQFFNRCYAQAFSAANAASIRSGFLAVEVRADA